METKQALIGKIKRNALGTTSFEMKTPVMRKFQQFSVYPITEATEEIKVQSATRIGLININSGIGKVTKSHASGAYFVHYTMGEIQGTLEEFSLSNVDLSGLKLHIFSTANERAGGEAGIFTDNSGAVSVLGFSNQ